MKKDVFLLLLCFVALTVCAQDPVEYKDLWYTLDTDNSIATVVANPTGEGYSGEVVIPDAVEYGGKTYDVARIGDEAFCGTNIQSVTIGDKLMYIGRRAFAGVLPILTRAFRLPPPKRAGSLPSPPRPEIWTEAFCWTTAE